MPHVRGSCRPIWSMIVVAAFLASQGRAADPPTLPPLAELRITLDAPTTVIVFPQTEAYETVASHLADGLEHLTARRPSLVADTVSPRGLGAGPIVVLGNLMDGGLARSLYLQAYDFTDRAWPSSGGHVVRTIRDPFGTGADVVMVGGSDIDGVAAAASELISIIEHGGPTTGYLNRVKLGCWAGQIESYTKDLLGNDDSVWSRSGVAGSWNYMIQIARAGLGYLRTGNEAYLPVFKRELRRWFDHDVYHPRDDAPQMLHGRLYPLIIVWDLLRDHPSFSIQERHRFDEDFLFVFCSPEGPGRIGPAARHAIVRDNHGTRAGLDAFFGGRFFARRSRLPQAEEWLEVAERYFAPQMTSAKPVCDSWGHQWAASLYNTLLYAMASGKEEYFGSEALRLAAERALIAHPLGQGPLGYLSACAVATGKTGYLSLWESADYVGRRGAEMLDQGDEHLRSFYTGAPITRRDDLLGVVVAPVDRLWYETIDAAGFNPGELFRSGTSREACFDKVSIREGWTEQAFYLLFDGISGGNHSYQDANCLVQFCEGGLSWLGTAKSYNTSGTVRTQNGVLLALDGAGPGRLHRYARLLYAGEAGPYLAVAGALERVGELDWQRHIFRRRGQWTLVIDRVVARQAGEMLAERHWHVRGDVTARTDGVVSEQLFHRERRCLHLQSGGVPPEGLSGANDRTERVRLRATPGHPFELSTLLHVNQHAGRPDYRLTKTKTGWGINSGGDTEVVVVAPQGQDGVAVLTKDGSTRIGPAFATTMPAFAEALQTETPPGDETLALHPAAPPATLAWQSFPVGKECVTSVAAARDGWVAAGDAAGHVVLFSPTGARLASVKLPSRVIALHFFGNDLLVGEERGALTRLGPDGGERWQVVMPYVPMAWPYWSEYCSRVREITSADINGDGEEEILISNSDRRVYAFTGQGKQIWKASVEWGVYTAMTAGLLRNGFALYGGTSQPSMHGWCIVFDAEGKVAARYSRPDLVSWSIPCQFRDMRLADVEGDGEVEVINALDTNCRQLVVYEPDGKVRWDADVAGAAQAIAVRSSGQANERVTTIYCASAAGYVYAFDGGSGVRRWVCFIGEPSDFVAALGRDAILAICRSGSVFVIDHRGALVGRHALGTQATAFLRPGDHRPATTIVLGTSDGRLLQVRHHAGHRADE